MSEAPKTVFTLEIGAFPTDGIGPTLFAIALRVRDLLRTEMPDCGQSTIRNYVAALRVEKQSLIRLIERSDADIHSNIWIIARAIWLGLDREDKAWTAKIRGSDRESAEPQKSSKSFQRFLDGRAD